MTFNSKRVTRRTFTAWLCAASLHLTGFRKRDRLIVMTVTGELDPAALGTTLIHEHILVDFIGAQQINPDRWNHDEVIKKVLPYLEEARKAGCNTLVDCTPNFLGRDVALLQKLSRLSNINIITNTGYYGGSDNKFLPPDAFTEDAETLAKIWIRESENGIDGTSVKPGFIKISVNPGALSDISKKLVRAAAFTHLKTGLTIASHTGPALAAFEQLDILQREGVRADAFIWVHAQNEKDIAQFYTAAKQGCWVSLDGLNDNNVEQYVRTLRYLKQQKCLNKVLVSHDAGWYDPGKPDGGDFRGYTTLFTKLIPALTREGFTDSEITQITRENPKRAFTIKLKKR